MFLSPLSFGSGGGPVNPLPGGFAVSDVPGNAPATAGWRFNPDGTVDARVEPTGWVLGIHHWYYPTTPGIGSSYWLFGDQLTGSPIDTGTLNAWISLASPKTFTDTVVASQNLARLHFEIASDSGGVNVVTESDGSEYNIDVLSEP